jgi:hypothetical protein
MERLIGTNSTNNEGRYYIRALDEFCNYHKLYTKVDRILNELNNTEYRDIHEINAELNKIDNLLTQGMLVSEKKHCKRKPKTMWSPQLSESHKLIEFWNVVDKSYNNQLDS